MLTNELGGFLAGNGNYLKLHAAPTFPCSGPTSTSERVGSRRRCEPTLISNVVLQSHHKTIEPFYSYSFKITSDSRTFIMRLSARRRICAFAMQQRTSKTNQEAPTTHRTHAGADQRIARITSSKQPNNQQTTITSAKNENRPNCRPSSCIRYSKNGARIRIIISQSALVGEWYYREMIRQQTVPARPSLWQCISSNPQQAEHVRFFVGRYESHNEYVSLVIEAGDIVIERWWASKWNLQKTIDQMYDELDRRILEGESWH